MKHIKLYENFNDDDMNFVSDDEMNIYNEIVEYLMENDFDFYDGEEDFKNHFIEVINTPNLSSEEKTESLCGFLDEKWGLYEGYSDVYEFIETLFNQ